MLCYKDRSWCSASDCKNTKCIRNINNKEEFTPDEFMRKYIAFMPYHKNCSEYTESYKNNTTK